MYFFRWKRRNLSSLLFILLTALTFTACGGGGGGGGGSAASGSSSDVRALSALPGNGQVTLIWNSVSGVTNYRIYQTSPDMTASAASYTEVAAPATQYTVSGLANNTAYRFTLRTINASGLESTGVSITVMPNASGLIASSNINPSGSIFNGGFARATTVVMTGSVPVAPGANGSAPAYPGSAFLLVNGRRVQVNVRPGAGDQMPDPVIKYKDGMPHIIGSGMADYSWLNDNPDGDATSWVFQVTFSVNAGPNTLALEAYDLNNCLFARTDDIKFVGTIEPTDLTVTLSWNTNNTDIDLHMSPDGGATHCYYSNMAAGNMVLDYDNVTGYGPEHITVDGLVGRKTYAIKVYYYDDDNVDSEGNPVVPTTPTTASVTADVNGEVILSESATLTTDSSVSSWTSGAHVWDVGEIEVQGANVLNVTMGAPDLSGWPTVTVPVTVLDPSNNDEPFEGLTADNFYVINAGMIMSPITVSAGVGTYTVQYTDITAGKRDVFIYIHKKIDPPADRMADTAVTPFIGGLSNTITYGSNYALMVGLNEYPPSGAPINAWYKASAVVDVEDLKTPSHITSINTTDFVVTFSDSTNTTPPVSVIPSGISAQGSGVYRLSYAAAADDPYDRISVTYKYQSWLENCINDINDMRTALLAKGVQDDAFNSGALMSNTMWEAAKITTLTNAAATEAAITAQIAAIAAGMNKYDLFLFHFSGHGSDGAADGGQYLCAYEDANWISVTDLSTALTAIPKATGQTIVNTFINLDACFSGNFIGLDMQPDVLDAGSGMVMARKKWRPFLPQAEAPQADALDFAALPDLSGGNLFVMTAANGDQPAWDANSLGNGVFTYYLVEGINTSTIKLKNTKANSNKDVWVTGQEAFRYASPKITAYVTTANGFPAGSAQNPQVFPTNQSGTSRLIYNW